MSIYAYGATVQLSTSVTNAAGDPADATTVALTIQRDDGSVVGPFTLAAAQVVRDGVGAYHYDHATAAAGRHVARWETTGPDGVDEASFYVTPQWGEAWRPSLAEVAGHIPTRTLDLQATPGSETYADTFTETTTPTAVQAQRIIDAATLTVAATVPTVTPALEALARDAAGWRAAADIELAYPDRDADVSVYAQLDARAKLALDRLTTAADDGGAGADASLPAWSMPDPVAHGDLDL